MKENWLKCQECPTRASGLWIVYLYDERKRLVRLCARCGLYDYIHKRETFSPGLRLELLKTFWTEFRQIHTPTPTVPSKHWVEHKPVPERKYNGITASQLLKANAITRHGKSTVHPSLLNFHKD